jgi:hypothetical protein
MYPSDYGYAISGGSTTDRTACLAKSMRYWDEVSDCYNSDFLYLKSTEWTLTQHFGYASWLFAVNKSMKVLGFNASVSLAARPVGYLVSSTVILSGNGSNETPWIVGA